MSELICDRCGKEYKNLAQHKKTKKYQMEGGASKISKTYKDKLSDDRPSKIINNIMIPMFYDNLTEKRKYQSGYFKNKNNIKINSIHWGQRKLFLTELYFLSNYYDDSKDTVVIYAGSAPGTHLNFFMKIYPKIIWELIDPREIKVKKTQNVNIHHQYFTDDFALLLKNKYIDKTVLFISDIRTSIDDTAILRDLMMQKSWVEIMQPKFSMLKFKLPYELSHSMEYFNGVILLQGWAPLASTEARLIVSDAFKSKTYYTTDYEEKFFYHNTITRQKSLLYNGFCGTWDYIYEIKIIEDHLFKSGQITKIDNLSHKDSLSNAKKILAFQQKINNYNKNFKNNLVEKAGKVCIE